MLVSSLEVTVYHWIPFSLYFLTTSAARTSVSLTQQTKAPTKRLKLDESLAPSGYAGGIGVRPRDLQNFRLRLGHAVADYNSCLVGLGKSRDIHQFVLLPVPLKCTAFKC